MPSASATSEYVSHFSVIQLGPVHVPRQPRTQENSNGDLHVVQLVLSTQYVEHNKYPANNKAGYERSEYAADYGPDNEFENWPLSIVAHLSP